VKRPFYVELLVFAARFRGCFRRPLLRLALGVHEGLVAAASPGLQEAQRGADVAFQRRLAEHQGHVALLHLRERASSIDHLVECESVWGGGEFCGLSEKACAAANCSVKSFAELSVKGISRQPLVSWLREPQHPHGRARRALKGWGRGAQPCPVETRVEQRLS